MKYYAVADLDVTRPGVDTGVRGEGHELVAEAARIGAAS
jgi:hypothetical protein